MYFCDTITYFVGPLPPYFCYIMCLIRPIIKTNALMFLNAIVVSKYIFIFWMKNPASIDDDFWSLFISLWSIGFSCIFNFVQIWFQQIFYFYICADVSKSSDQTLGPKNNAQVDFLITILIHIAITIRVNFYKNNRIEENIQVSNVACTTSNFAFHGIGEVKLADFVTNFLLSLWFGSLSFLQWKINHLSLSEVNQNNIATYIIGFLYYGSSLTGLIISSIYFSRHPHLRRKMTKEIALLIKK